MKTVILAGGRGTRLAEETHAIPKPMVAIGGRPILWHIMSHYARYGLRRLRGRPGYKGYVIKEYFANHLLHECDMSVDLASGLGGVPLPERPGLDASRSSTPVQHSMTGGRLERLAPAR